MIDVATLIPYTRFLEVRARRLQIAVELSQDALGKSNAKVASAPIVDDATRQRRTGRSNIPARRLEWLKRSRAARFPMRSASAKASGAPKQGREGGGYPSATARRVRVTPLATW